MKILIIMLLLTTYSKKDNQSKVSVYSAETLAQIRASNPNFDGSVLPGSEIETNTLKTQSALLIEDRFIPEQWECEDYSCWDLSKEVYLLPKETITRLLQSSYSNIYQEFLSRSHIQLPYETNISDLEIPISGLGLQEYEFLLKKYPVDLVKPAIQIIWDEEGISETISS